MPIEDEQHAEYLAALQAQVDRLTDRNEALERRVGRLEADRETLRARLASRGSRFRRPTAEPVAGPPVDTPSADRSVEIPGVGRIPDLAFPTEHPARVDLRVATVLDPFSRAAFGYEFACVDVTPDDWLEVLEPDPPDLLFVESAYQGKDRTWATRVARFGSPHPSLAALVGWCRDRSIPTVFWNKEDPINYDWFVSSAGLFDHVFTVDADTISRYTADLGHRRVEGLPFAAQPAIHHPPADESTRRGAVAFAGSYYAAKHAGRRQQMDMLLDPAREFGLQIFDRHGTSPDPRFAWPERFRPNIVGSLTYPQTVEAYRRYRAFLNVNTVVDSPTMCARRIFELVACGTRVVSGPSRAITEIVPAGVVALAETRAQAVEALRAALEEPGAETEAGLEWIRDGHTYRHRVDRILDLVG